MSDKTPRDCITDRLRRLEEGGPRMISDYGVMEVFDYRLSEYLAALRARISELEASPTERPALSKWQGWDQGRDGWAEDKHKDRVCAAVFGETWAMEDAHELISFIDRAWGKP